MNPVEITCDGEAPEEFSLESVTSAITTITHYFLEALPRAIKPMTEKTASFSGNRTNLSFPGDEGFFSLENQENLLKIYLD